MEDNNRTKAMKWWRDLNLEDQFFVILQHNNLIAGDHTRHPSTLTGREIEKIFVENRKYLDHYQKTNP